MGHGQEDQADRVGHPLHTTISLTPPEAFASVRAEAVAASDFVHNNLDQARAAGRGLAVAERIEHRAAPAGAGQATGVRLPLGLEPALLRPGGAVHARPRHRGQ